MQISIGEKLDKLSILFLKKENIKNEEKLLNINNEIQNICLNIDNNLLNSLEYKCLYIINEKIWKLMDKIKEINILDNSYNFLANQIFRENDARFRCKKLLNEKSFIKEEKSYGKETVIFLGFPEININIKETYTYFLNLYFDNVIYIDNKNNLISPTSPLGEKEKENIFIYDILNTDNINNLNYSFLYNLDNKKLIDTILNEKCNEKINYLNTGRLGDLIHVLYVIKNKYLTTGKKGNLYIQNGEFINIETVYADIKNLINSQEYIETINIYSYDINIDINLDLWRHSHLLYNTHWYNILTNHYQIPFIVMEWFKYYYYLPKINDKYLINRSLNRKFKEFPWDKITTKYKCVFISFSEVDYLDFNFKNTVEYLKVNSFDEMVKNIYLYDNYIGNLSAPMAIAYSMGKNCLAEIIGPDEIHYRDLPNMNFISPEEIKIKNFFIN